MNFEEKKSDDIKFMERGDSNWYLYHSIKNENALVPVIVLSFLSFFCKGGGWVVSIGIWIWYFIYCHNNNEALNRDPQILKERELAKAAHKKCIERLKRIEEANNDNN